MTTETTTAELSALLLEAGTDPDLWELFLPTLSRSFPGLKSSIHFAFSDTNHQKTLLVDGIEMQMVRNYDVHYGKLNPWNSFWQTISPFQTMVSDEISPSFLYKKTEFYDGWLRPLDACSAVGMKLATDGDGFGVISLHYGASRAEVYNRDLSRMIQRLAGPLRNAISVSRLRTKGALASGHEYLLFALEEPAFLLDGAGRMHSCNQLGDELLRQGTLVFRDRLGRLVPRDREAVPHLARAVEAVRLIEVLPGAELPAAFALRSGEGSVTGFAKVVAAPAPDKHVPGWGILIGASRHALLTIHPRRRKPSPSETLQRVFGLTAAEARLAVRMQGGHSLNEIADELGLSRETLRQQLKGVFSKTGTNRQVELVLLLSRLP